jgi:hypothetical protein
MLMSGPGCTPRRRNIRAAGLLIAWQDQENTARRFAVPVPAESRSRRRRVSRSSAASELSGARGWAMARDAAMFTAKGRRAHRPISSSAAACSLVMRAGPSRRTSSSRASLVVSRSTVSGMAPSRAIRSVSRLRLVISTMQPAAPGSKGRTCSGSRALSKTIRMRLSASTLRYKPIWAPRSAGMRPAGTCSASRNLRTAVAACMGAQDGSNPRRSTYSCPSGKRARTRCAQCTASVVLPTPAVPATAEITTDAGSTAAAG